MSRTVRARSTSAGVEDPTASLLAQINEASTRLQVAVRRLRDGDGRSSSVVEPLERRGLMSASAASSAADVMAATTASLNANLASTRPSITSTSPSNNAAGVLRDAFVSANISVPKGGIDTTTLTAATVKLYRTSDGAVVAASTNTSAGGDVLVLSPSALLDPDTDYTFEVTAGLRDVSGNAFLPFTMRFRTGAAVASGGSTLKFDKVALDTPKAPYTAITKGPDGRLYAGTETGDIVRFDIRPDGTLTNAQIIRSLIDANGGTPRLLTGIEFDPASTANDLVLWTTHSYYAVDNGPDWTGKVTRLSGPDLATAQDYVVGLPRSTRDHVTNQLKFGPDGAIYFPQASNTAMGAPDYAWHYRSERYLSAAILRLDVGLVRDRLMMGQGPINVQTDEGHSYNPYTTNAPLTIYASGVRNAYDLVWHSNGSLYAPTNGSQRGGSTPAGPGVPAIDFVEQVEDDYLFRISQGGYYGHPNPSRGQFVRNGGNPTAGADPFELTQYPVGVQPDSNYRTPAFDFGQHYSPNGAIEYRGGAFGGTLDGKILVARYSGGDDIVVLTVGADGSIVEAQGGIAGMKNFNDPVDLIEDRATGFLYVAEFGGQRITLVKPSVPGAPGVEATPPSRVPLGPHGLAVTPLSVSETQLRWVDTVGEQGYRIERSADGKTGWGLIGATGANETTYRDTGLARGTTYFYRVRAANGAGDSKTTAVASGTTLSIVLPAGWSGQDVGTVGRAGTADYRDGVFELVGSGHDIEGGADGFFFASMPVSGDIEIVARVNSVGLTNGYAKAGVMIRAGAAADAPNAMMTTTASHGAQFQTRETAGVATAVTPVTAGQEAAPVWVRLVRRGETVSGYTSADGTRWTRVAFARLSAGSSVLAGLAVSAHDNTALCAATFDNVRIGAPASLAVPEAPTEFSATPDGTHVVLSWHDNSLEETAFEIERRRAGGTWMRVATVGPETTGYDDTHLAASKKYEYRVRAINVAGASVSPEVAAKTGKSTIRGQQPFFGTPAAVPGVIQAEEFDEGPRNKAWKDRTPENDYGVFRDTGVDIEQTTDAGGGHHVAAAAKGEWLEYTVNVPAAGEYTLDLRFAAADGFGGAVSFSADGRNVTLGGAFALPATGGWNVWQTAGGVLNLKAGVQVLRLTLDAANNAGGDVANLNWIRLTPAAPQTAAALWPARAPLSSTTEVHAPRIYDQIFNATTPIV